MKIKKIKDDLAEVENSGIVTCANISLIENPQVNDYVIVHAGFAIEKLDKNEAELRLELFKKLAEAKSSETLKVIEKPLENF